MVGDQLRMVERHAGAEEDPCFAAAFALMLGVAGVELHAGERAEEVDPTSDVAENNTEYSCIT